MKKIKKKYSEYFHWGLTAFIVIACALLLYVILASLGYIFEFIGRINRALMPIYIGLVVAYLLAPIVNWFDKYAFVPLVKKIVRKKEKRARGIARGISVIVTMIIAILIVAGLMMLVIPELVNSISSLVKNMPGYYANIRNWGNGVFAEYPKAASYFDGFTKNAYSWVLNWLQNDLLPNSTKLLSIVTDSVVDVVMIFVDVIIGVIVSVYLLISKETFCGISKRIVFSVFKKKRAKSVLLGLGEAHDVFSSFISGKIIDCLLIGLITYIVIRIAGIPYALLISVLIGVTNLIPFFGQFIGIIPSAILVFIANPIKGLIFVVLIIILMQLDANVIGPKIMGESIGLKSFWILFSIIFFGNLFGLLGMIMAVPVFALMYRYTKRWSEKRLSKNGLPVDTSFYVKKMTEKSLEDFEEKHYDE